MSALWKQFGPALGRAGAVFLLWTLIGSAFAAQLYLTQAKSGMSWNFALGRALADWYLFAVLSLPAFWLAKRYPLEGPAWLVHGLIHAAAGAVFSLSWIFLRPGIEVLQARARLEQISFRDAFEHVLVATFVFNSLVYWVIIAVRHAFQYARKFNERERRAIELERLLAEARLQTLQMQLNPHFLFNTLNTIAALVHKDADLADRMIVQLSQLLRHALDRRNDQEVSLRQELDFLRRYIEIERARFGDRLVLAVEVPNDCLDALVPNLVLQPLVENSIRHGLASRAHPGRIEIHAARQDQRLRVSVRDNGTGLKDGPLRQGIGLSNTRARLEHLHGAAQTFTWQAPASGGFEVCFEIPFRIRKLPSQ